MSFSTSRIAAYTIGLIFGVAGLSAAGQQAGTRAAPDLQDPSSGPMIVERVTGGFVLAPDLKVTEVDDATGALIGGYAGWLFDQTWLIGGAGYWLANDADDLDLAYGGLVVGWTMNGSRRIGFGARGLIGGGQATLSDTVFGRLAPGGHHGGRLLRVDRDGASGDQVPIRVEFDETFFVFEPQANVVIRLTKQIRLDWGVSYRIVDGARGFEDRLRGVAGSVAVRFGGGS